MKIGESIYHCRLISSDNTKVYSTPVKYITRLNYISVQNKTGFVAATQYGKDIKQYVQLVCRPYISWKGVINVNDLFFINKIPSNTELIGTKGIGADYIVDSVAPQNLSIIVTLKKRA